MRYGAACEAGGGSAVGGGAAIVNGGAAGVGGGASCGVAAVAVPARRIMLGWDKSRQHPKVFPGSPPP